MLSSLYCSSGRKVSILEVFFIHLFNELSHVASSCLHDVLLVLCRLTDNLSIAGLNGLDENSLLGVNL